MSDKNLTTFLTEWGGQVKELIEPKQEKLTPEFYLGSKANPVYDVITSSRFDSLDYEYIGDGELSVSDENVPGTVYFENNQIYFTGSGSGLFIVTSAETNNYKAGEWTFTCHLDA